MADRAVIDYHTSTTSQNWATTMPMLDVHDRAFREQYPAGCRIYDASGRLLRFVVACNPETGEVICWKANRIMATLLRIVKGKDWSYGDCLFRRHGFWPAPLRVVPLP